MYYYLATQEVMPGRMPEYAEIASKELIPTYAKVGLKLVGSWHGTTGSPNTIYALFVFNDLTEFQKVTQAARQDKDYASASAKISKILTSQGRQLIEPNAWSPMK